MRLTERVLEPVERIAEILFGLIMTLTFTGTIGAMTGDSVAVRTVLVGALGCNIAWGIIDAVLYLMGSLAERGRGITTLRAVRNAADPGRAQRLIADALPSVVASILDPAELESMHRRLKQLPEPADRARLHKDDLLGAVGVFLLVFLSLFPVAIPFLLMDNAVPALRFSNAIAMGMLFVLGVAFGRITGRRPWAVGLSMVFLGALLVALAIALGG
jgi:hypothetical protein